MSISTHKLYRIILSKIILLLILSFTVPLKLNAQGTCASATTIGALPYSQNGLTNCGRGANYSGTPACMNNTYFIGEDYVFRYTPSANQCVNISTAITGGSPWNSGMAIIDRCPTTAGAVCVGSVTGVTGVASLVISNINLVSGTTYYIVVSGGQSLFASPPNECMNFNFSIATCPPPPPPPYSGVACGLNYVHGDVLIQRRSNAATPPFNVGSGLPASVTIAGLPSCYIIDKAYLYFVASFSSPFPPNPSVSITNPASVTGNFTPIIAGTSGDKCWGDNGSATYRTDVTTNISGNGVYNFNITGFANGSNEVDGASLLIIFRDPNATYQGSLTLWDGARTSGNFNSVPATQSVTLTGFNACANSTFANTFLLVSDMQSNINGGNHNSMLNGVTASYPNNFWCWDQTNTTVTAGQNTANYNSNGQSQDCFTIALVGLYFRTTSCVTCTPAVLTLNNSNNTATCGNCNGSASVTATGGTTPYTYSWAPSGGTNATASNLCVGNYTVTVRDANNCLSSTSVVVVPGTGGSTVTATSQTMCAGTSATITATPTTGGGTYSWNPGGQTSSAITVSPAITTTYTVTYTLAGCSNTATGVVTVTALPTVTVNSPTICQGASATLTAAGATTYLWSTGVTSNPITVTPGSTTSYTVTGTTNNCSRSAVATVTITTPPAATASANSPCVGSTLNLTSTGGTSWSWAGPGGYTSTSQNPTRPSATTAMDGTYTVTVTTAGCTGTATVNVTITPNPIVTVNSATICQGGSAVLTANGGTTYVWSTTQTTNPITVTPGATASYTVTVTTGTCSASAVATVTVNPPCGVNVTTTSATICEGSCATITANASSGTAPYIYLWATGGGTTSSVSVCPTATTTYTVTVTDNTGATASTTSVVTVNFSPTVTVNSETVCPGGSATLIATGGSGTYSWSTGATASVITVSPTATTTYIIICWPTNGCSASASAVVTVNPNPVVTVNSPGICPGGAATLTAAGATTYLWSTAETINPISVSPTVNTSYTVTGTSLGCTASALATVTVGSLTASAGTDVSICFGASTTLNATGGTSYSWSPATGLSNSTIANPIASPAATTTYTVTATAGACSATDAVVVNVNSQITLATSGIDMTCNGICNGQIIVIPSGGTTPYAYNWSNGCTSAACSNICAGTYSLTVTDGNACTATAIATVNEPPALTAAVSGSTPANCFGVCDGTATVSATGGTTPYTYSWNTSPVQTTATATGLCATSYTCTVSDFNNCTVKTSVTIFQPTAVTLTPIAPVTICAGGSTTLTTVASGGTPGYTYVWLPLGAGATAAVTVSPAGTTTYTVSVADANGCTASPRVVVVTVNPALTVNATGATAICPGSSATLTAAAGGGNGGPYTYSWTPGGATTSTISVSPIVTTNYTVTVSDACGTLPVTDTVTVIALPVPVIAFTADVTSGCAPLCVNFTNGTTVLNDTISSWGWNFSDAPASTTANPSHCFNKPGQYSITLTATSGNGCSSTFTNTNMINVFVNPVAGFSTAPDPVTILDPNVTFNNLSSSDVNYWFWIFGDGDSLAPDISNPVHTYPKESQGTYTTTLIVRNANGCYDTVSHDVVIDPLFTFYIPNAFTPNNDGINDVFFGKGEGIMQYDIWIFDRWGNMIFHGKELNDFWNGKANGGSQVAQQDVYVWKVVLTDVFYKKHDYIGTVTLVK
ncbi:MAG: PKD domain-containing protein [Bacteroidota bacterium]